MSTRPRRRPRCKVPCLHLPELAPLLPLIPTHAPRDLPTSPPRPAAGADAPAPLLLDAAGAVQHAARITTLPTDDAALRHLLCLGLLVRGLGALAATCRFFGQPRRHGLWERPARLSLCEAAIRTAYRACPPIPGCALPEIPLGRSAGRALLSRTFATAGLRIEGGVLKGLIDKGKRAGLVRLVIPHGVTSIGKEAFKGCPSLAEVHIPQGVTSIGSFAFYNCSSLAEISVPEGATIERGAFDGCSGLGSIRLAELQARYPEEESDGHW